MRLSLKSLAMAMLWAVTTKSAMALPATGSLSKCVEETDTDLPKQYLQGRPSLETFETANNGGDTDSGQFDVDDISDFDLQGNNDIASNPYANLQAAGYPSSSLADGNDDRSFDDWMSDISVKDIKDGTRSNVNIDNIIQTDKGTPLNLLPEEYAPKNKQVIA